MDIAKKNKKYLLVGNWKMNTDISSAEDLAEEMAVACVDTEQEVVICPPVVFTEQCSLVLAEQKDAKLKLGVQNISWEEMGALTGDVSILMVKNWVEYVIVGHSERRQYFTETSNIVNKKLKLCLKYNKIPVLCVGEKRFSSSQDVADIGRELSDSIAGITREEMEKVVIAYEPVWAIGSGNAADPGYVGRIIAGLRSWIKDEYDFDTAEKVKMLYGGSVSEKNAREYLSKDQIDGLLVGGASLKAKSFAKIVGIADKI
jgi:triosephosphate isomerase